MPKAARIFAPISAPRIYTERSAVPVKHSDTSEFIGVAIFSGIKDGDTVATRSLNGLTLEDGVPVKVVR